MKTKNAAEIFSDVLNSKKPLKIKLLGDSITHGVGGTGWQQNGETIVPGWAQSPDGYSWANLFRDHMQNTYGATVVNKACTGTTVEFIIQNFSSLVDDDDDVILCTIGTNNRHQYFSQGEKMSRETIGQIFYENVKRLHNLFLDSGKQVVFMANIPASEKDEQDGPDYWRILHMCDINAIYKEIAKDCGVTVISLYDLFTDYCKANDVTVDSLLIDGLHPNDKGYRVMYELIVKALGV